MASNALFFCNLQSSVMPDNQVFTNPSNSHCSMSQPVQNLSKFSIRIKSFSALFDRRLLWSVRMSPALLKTPSPAVLVGRPIKRQRQPISGLSFKLRILTDSYLRISVKHQVSTQRVATASLASKV